jgi:hypothetical protein
MVTPEVLGAPPAPPPTTTAFALSGADEAMLVAPEKYGTPPLVPEGARVNVPNPVTGEPEIVNTVLVANKPTLVTEPPVGA